MSLSWMSHSWMSHLWMSLSCISLFQMSVTQMSLSWIFLALMSFSLMSLSPILLSPDVPLPDVHLSDVPLPDVPLPNVPLPDVPIPEACTDGSVGEELTSPSVVEEPWVWVESGSCHVSFRCCNVFISGTDKGTHGGVLFVWVRVVAFFVFFVLIYLSQALICTWVAWFWNCSGLIFH
jgi:hypothetical protein